MFSTQNAYAPILLDCKNIQLRRSHSQAGSASRKTISKQSHLKLYFDYDFSDTHSSQIANDFERYIKETRKHKKETPAFVEEILNKILFLHKYNLKVAEVSFKYPLTKNFKQLLLHFIALQCKVLYRGEFHSPRYERVVGERILRLLLNIYNSHFEKLETIPPKKIFEESAKAILKLLIQLKLEFDIQNKLLENMAKKLLNKLGQLKNVMALKEKCIPCPLDTYLHDPTVVDTCKNIITSDYGTDDDQKTEDDCIEIDNDEQNNDSLDFDFKPQIDDRFRASNRFQPNQDKNSKVPIIYIDDEEQNNDSDNFDVDIKPQIDDLFRTSNRLQPNQNKSSKVPTVYIDDDDGDIMMYWEDEVKTSNKSSKREEKEKEKQLVLREKQNKAFTNHRPIKLNSSEITANIKEEEDDFALSSKDETLKTTKCSDNLLNVNSNTRRERSFLNDIVVIDDDCVEQSKLSSNSQKLVSNTSSCLPQVIALVENSDTINEPVKETHYILSETEGDSTNEENLYAKENKNENYYEAKGKLKISSEITSPIFFQNNSADSFSGCGFSEENVELDNFESYYVIEAHKSRTSATCELQNQTIQIQNKVESTLQASNNDKVALHQHMNVKNNLQKDNNSMSDIETGRIETASNITKNIVRERNENNEFTEINFVEKIEADRGNEVQLIQKRSIEFEEQTCDNSLSHDSREGNYTQVANDIRLGKRDDKVPLKIDQNVDEIGTFQEISEEKEINNSKEAGEISSTQPPPLKVITNDDDSLHHIMNSNPNQEIVAANIVTLSKSTKDMMQDFDSSVDEGLINNIEKLTEKPMVNAKFVEVLNKEHNGDSRSNEIVLSFQKPIEDVNAETLETINDMVEEKIIHMEIPHEETTDQEIDHEAEASTDREIISSSNVKGIKSNILEDTDSVVQYSEKALTSLEKLPENKQLRSISTNNEDFGTNIDIKKPVDEIELVQTCGNEITEESVEQCISIQKCEQICNVSRPHEEIDFITEKILSNTPTSQIIEVEEKCNEEVNDKDTEKILSNTSTSQIMEVEEKCNEEVNDKDIEIEKHQSTQNIDLHGGNISGHTKISTDVCEILNDQVELDKPIIEDNGKPIEQNSIASLVGKPQFHGVIDNLQLEENNELTRKVNTKGSENYQECSQGIEILPSLPDSLPINLEESTVQNTAFSTEKSTVEERVIESVDEEKEKNVTGENTKNVDNIQESAILNSDDTEVSVDRGMEKLDEKSTDDTLEISDKVIFYQKKSLMENMALVPKECSVEKFIETIDEEKGDKITEKSNQDDCTENVTVDESFQGLALTEKVKIVEKNIITVDISQESTILNNEGGTCEESTNDINTTVGRDICKFEENLIKPSETSVNVINNQKDEFNKNKISELISTDITDELIQQNVTFGIENTITEEKDIETIIEKKEENITEKSVQDSIESVTAEQCLETVTLNESISRNDIEMVNSQQNSEILKNEEKTYKISSKDSEASFLTEMDTKSVDIINLNQEKISEIAKSDENKVASELLSTDMTDDSVGENLSAVTENATVEETFIESIIEENVIKITEKSVQGNNTECITVGQCPKEVALNEDATITSDRNMDDVERLDKSDILGNREVCNAENKEVFVKSEMKEDKKKVSDSLEEIGKIILNQEEKTVEISELEVTINEGKICNNAENLENEDTSKNLSELNVVDGFNKEIFCDKNPNVCAMSKSSSNYIDIEDERLNGNMPKTTDFASHEEFHDCIKEAEFINDLNITSQNVPTVVSSDAPNSMLEKMKDALKKIGTEIIASNDKKVESEKIVQDLEICAIPNENTLLDLLATVASEVPRQDLLTPKRKKKASRRGRKKQNMYKHKGAVRKSKQAVKIVTDFEQKCKPHDFVIISNSEIPPPANNNIYTQKLPDISVTSEDSNDSGEGNLLIDEDVDIKTSKHQKEIKEENKITEATMIQIKNLSPYDEDTFEEEITFACESKVKGTVLISIPDNYQANFDILKQIEEMELCSSKKLSDITGKVGDRKYENVSNSTNSYMTKDFSSTDDLTNQEYMGKPETNYSLNGIVDNEEINPSLDQLSSKNRNLGVNSYKPFRTMAERKDYDKFKLNPYVSIERLNICCKVKEEEKCIRTRSKSFDISMIRNSERSCSDVRSQQEVHLNEKNIITLDISDPKHKIEDEENAHVSDAPKNFVKMIKSTFSQIMENSSIPHFNDDNLPLAKLKKNLETECHTGEQIHDSGLDDIPLLLRKQNKTKGRQKRVSTKKKKGKVVRQKVEKHQTKDGINKSITQKKSTDEIVEAHDSIIVTTRLRRKTSLDKPEDVVCSHVTSNLKVLPETDSNPGNKSDSREFSSAMTSNVSLGQKDSPVLKFEIDHKQTNIIKSEIESISFSKTPKKPEKNIYTNEEDTVVNSNRKYYATPKLRRKSSISRDNLNRIERNSVDVLLSEESLNSSPANDEKKLPFSADKKYTAPKHRWKTAVEYESIFTKDTPKEITQKQFKSSTDKVDILYKSKNPVSPTVEKLKKILEIDRINCGAILYDNNSEILSAKSTEGNILVERTDRGCDNHLIERDVVSKGRSKQDKSRNISKASVKIEGESTTTATYQNNNSNYDNLISTSNEKISEGNIQFDLIRDDFINDQNVINEEIVEHSEILYEHPLMADSNETPNTREKEVKRIEQISDVVELENILIGVPQHFSKDMDKPDEMLDVNEKSTVGCEMLPINLELTVHNQESEVVLKEDAENMSMVINIKSPEKADSLTLNPSTIDKEIKVDKSVKQIENNENLSHKLSNPEVQDEIDQICQGSSNADLSYDKEIKKSINQHEDSVNDLDNVPLLERALKLVDLQGSINKSEKKTKLGSDKKNKKGVSVDMETKVQNDGKIHEADTNMESKINIEKEVDIKLSENVQNKGKFHKVSSNAEKNSQRSKNRRCSDKQNSPITSTPNEQEVSNIINFDKKMQKSDAKLSEGFKETADEGNSVNKNKNTCVDELGHLEYKDEKIKADSARKKGKQIIEVDKKSIKLNNSEDIKEDEDSSKIYKKIKDSRESNMDKTRTPLIQAESTCISSTLENDYQNITTVESHPIKASNMNLVKKDPSIPTSKGSCSNSNTVNDSKRKEHYTKSSEKSISNRSKEKDRSRKYYNKSNSRSSSVSSHSSSKPSTPDSELSNKYKKSKHDKTKHRSGSVSSSSSIRATSDTLEKERRKHHDRERSKIKHDDSKSKRSSSQISQSSVVNTTSTSGGNTKKNSDDTKLVEPRSSNISEKLSKSSKKTEIKVDADNFKTGNKTSSKEDKKRIDKKKERNKRKSHTYTKESHIPSPTKRRKTGDTDGKAIENAADDSKIDSNRNISNPKIKLSARSKTEETAGDSDIKATRNATGDSKISSERKTLKPKIKQSKSGKSGHSDVESAIGVSKISSDRKISKPKVKRPELSKVEESRDSDTKATENATGDLNINNNRKISKPKIKQPELSKTEGSRESDIKGTQNAAGDSKTSSNIKISRPKIKRPELSNIEESRASDIKATENATDELKISSDRKISKPVIKQLGLSETEESRGSDIKATEVATGDSKNSSDRKISKPVIKQLGLSETEESRGSDIKATEVATGDSKNSSDRKISKPKIKRQGSSETEESRGSDIMATADATGDSKNSSDRKISKPKIKQQGSSETEESRDSDIMATADATGDSKNSSDRKISKQKIKQQGSSETEESRGSDIMTTADATSDSKNSSERKISKPKFKRPELSSTEESGASDIKATENATDELKISNDMKISKPKMKQQGSSETEESRGSDIMATADTTGDSKKSSDRKISKPKFKRPELSNVEESKESDIKAIVNATDDLKISSDRKISNPKIKPLGSSETEESRDSDIEVPADATGDSKISRNRKILKPKIKQPEQLSNTEESRKSDIKATENATEDLNICTDRKISKPKIKQPGSFETEASRDSDIKATADATGDSKISSRKISKPKIKHSELSITKESRESNIKATEITTEDLKISSNRKISKLKIKQPGLFETEESRNSDIKATEDATGDSTIISDRQISKPKIKQPELSITEETRESDIKATENATEDLNICNDRKISKPKIEQPELSITKESRESDINATEIDAEDLKISNDRKISKLKIKQPGLSETEESRNFDIKATEDTTSDSKISSNRKMSKRKINQPELSIAEESRESDIKATENATDDLNICSDRKISKPKIKQPGSFETEENRDYDIKATADATGESKISSRKISKPKIKQPELFITNESRESDINATEIDAEDLKISNDRKISKLKIKQPGLSETEESRNFDIKSTEDTTSDSKISSNRKMSKQPKLSITEESRESDIITTENATEDLKISNDREISKPEIKRPGSCETDFGIKAIEDATGDSKISSERKILKQEIKQPEMNTEENVKLLTECISGKLNSSNQIKDFAAEMKNINKSVENEDIFTIYHGTLQNEITQLKPGLEKAKNSQEFAIVEGLVLTKQNSESPKLEENSKIIKEEITKHRSNSVPVKGVEIDKNIPKFQQNLETDKKFEISQGNILNQSDDSKVLEATISERVECDNSDSKLLIVKDIQIDRNAVKSVESPETDDLSQVERISHNDNFKKVVEEPAKLESLNVEKWNEISVNGLERNSKQMIDSEVTQINDVLLNNDELHNSVEAEHPEGTTKDISRVESLNIDKLKDEKISSKLNQNFEEIPINTVSLLDNLSNAPEKKCLEELVTDFTYSESVNTKVNRKAPKLEKNLEEAKNSETAEVHNFNVGYDDSTNILEATSSEEVTKTNTKLASLNFEKSNNKIDKKGAVEEQKNSDEIEEENTIHLTDNLSKVSALKCVEEITKDSTNSESLNAEVREGNAKRVSELEQSSEEMEKSKIVQTNVICVEEITKNSTNLESVNAEVHKSNAEQASELKQTSEKIEKSKIVQPNTICLNDDDLNEVSEVKGLEEIDVTNSESVKTETNKSEFKHSSEDNKNSQISERADLSVNNEVIQVLEAENSIEITKDYTKLELSNVVEGNKDSENTYSKLDQDSEPAANENDKIEQGTNDNNLSEVSQIKSSEEAAKNLANLELLHGELNETNSEKHLCELQEKNIESVVNNAILQVNDFNFCENALNKNLGTEDLNKVTDHATELENKSELIDSNVTTETAQLENEKVMTQNRELQGTKQISECGTKQNGDDVCVVAPSSSKLKRENQTAEDIPEKTAPQLRVEDRESTNLSIDEISDSRNDKVTKHEKSCCNVAETVKLKNEIMKQTEKPQDIKQIPDYCMQQNKEGQCMVAKSLKSKFDKNKMERNMPVNAIAQLQEEYTGLVRQAVADSGCDKALTQEKELQDETEISVPNVAENKQSKDIKPGPLSNYADSHTSQYIPDVKHKKVYGREVKQKNIEKAFEQYLPTKPKENEETENKIDIAISITEVQDIPTHTRTVSERNDRLVNKKRKSDVLELKHVSVTKENIPVSDLSNKKARLEEINDVPCETQLNNNNPAQISPLFISPKKKERKSIEVIITHLKEEKSGNSVSSEVDTKNELKFPSVDGVNVNKLRSKLLQKIKSFDQGTTPPIKDVQSRRNSADESFIHIPKNMEITKGVPGGSAFNILQSESAETFEHDSSKNIADSPRESEPIVEVGGDSITYLSKKFNTITGTTRVEYNIEMGEKPRVSIPEKDSGILVSTAEDNLKSTITSKEIENSFLTPQSNAFNNDSLPRKHDMRDSKKEEIMDTSLNNVIESSFIDNSLHIPSIENSVIGSLDSSSTSLSGAGPNLLNLGDLIMHVDSIPTVTNTEEIAVSPEAVCMFPNIISTTISSSENKLPCSSSPGTIELFTFPVTSEADIKEEFIPLNEVSTNSDFLDDTNSSTGKTEALHESCVFSFSEQIDNSTARTLSSPGLPLNLQDVPFSDIPIGSTQSLDLISPETLSMVQTSRNNNFSNDVPIDNEIGNIMTEITCSNEPDDHNYTLGGPLLNGRPGQDKKDISPTTNIIINNKPLDDSPNEFSLNDTQLQEFEFSDDTYKLNLDNEYAVKNLVILGSQSSTDINAFPLTNYNMADIKRINLIDYSISNSEENTNNEEYLDSTVSPIKQETQNIPSDTNPWAEFIANENPNQKVVVLPNEQCLTITENELIESIRDKIVESGDKILETAGSISPSVGGICLPQETSKAELPKMTASTSKASLRRNRKNVSELPAQNDNTLNDFIIKRRYSRTVLRPKVKNAPTSVKGPKKEVTLETANVSEVGTSSMLLHEMTPPLGAKNITAISSKKSKLEDDTCLLELNKFIQANPEKIPKASNGTAFNTRPMEDLIVPQYESKRKSPLQSHLSPVRDTLDKQSATTKQNQTIPCLSKDLSEKGNLQQKCSESKKSPRLENLLQPTVVNAVKVPTVLSIVELVKTSKRAATNKYSNSYSPPTVAAPRETNTKPTETVKPTKSTSVDKSRLEDGVFSNIVNETRSKVDLFQPAQECKKVSPQNHLHIQKSPVRGSLPNLTKPLAELEGKGKSSCQTRSNIQKNIQDVLDNTDKLTKSIDHLKCDLLPKKPIIPPTIPAEPPKNTTSKYNHSVDSILSKDPKSYANNPKCENAVKDYRQSKNRGVKRGSSTTEDERETGKVDNKKQRRPDSDGAQQASSSRDATFDELRQQGNVNRLISLIVTEDNKLKPERRSSPLLTERRSSPLSTEKRNSPLPTERKNSPLSTERKNSPLLKSHNKEHNERDDGKLKPEKRNSPLMTKPSSNKEQNERESINLRLERRGSPLVTKSYSKNKEHNQRDSNNSSSSVHPVYDRSGGTRRDKNEVQEKRPESRRSHNHYQPPYPINRTSGRDSAVDMHRVQEGYSSDHILNRGRETRHSGYNRGREGHQSDHSRGREGLRSEHSKAKEGLPSTHSRGRGQQSDRSRRTEGHQSDHTRTRGGHQLDYPSTSAQSSSSSQPSTSRSSNVSALYYSNSTNPQGNQNVDPSDVASYQTSGPYAKRNTRLSQEKMEALIHSCQVKILDPLRPLEESKDEGEYSWIDKFTKRLPDSYLLGSSASTPQFFPKPSP